MKENEAIEVLKDFNKCVVAKADGAYETNDFIHARDMAIKALEELQMYKQGKLCLIPAYVFKKQCEALDAFKEIGTVEELQTLKENQRKCEDCAGCTTWKCDCSNVRAEAIDEAMKTSAKAICIGCGYLDGHKCTYEGDNCGVSKPMLETVVRALEQMKGSDTDA